LLGYTPCTNNPNDLLDSWNHRPDRRDTHTQPRTRERKRTPPVSSCEKKRKNNRETGKEFGNKIPDHFSVCVFIYMTNPRKVCGPLSAVISRSLRYIARYIYLMIVCDDELESPGYSPDRLKERLKPERQERRESHFYSSSSSSLLHTLMRERNNKDLSRTFPFHYWPPAI
jgi:hypothetical protein